MGQLTGPGLALRAALGTLALTALFGGGWFAYAGRAALPEACLAVGDRAAVPGDGMVRIPETRFAMGSERFRAEEAPVRQISVAGFWIDTHDVTNAEYARFVRETGYVTVAERGARPGAWVFRPPSDVEGLRDLAQWWRMIPGADWRHPEGPGSDLAGRDNHPVVQVAFEDAEAYARWAGRVLPTEAQWEAAARGGRDAEFIWADGADRDDTPAANHWRGEFPTEDRGSKGYRGTSPVGCFQANGYGLYDMAGNVWQWTRDPWTADHADGTAADASAHVIKGGSYLCAPNFCMRYRPAARQAGDAASGTSHIGFRTVLNAASGGS